MDEPLVWALDHITITAPHEQQDNVRWFYGNILGLQEIEVPSHVAGDKPIWFRVGRNQELHVSFESPVQNTIAPRHVGLKVRSVQKVVEALRSNGFDVSADLAGRGAARCFCRDPFGNRLEFVEYADG